MTEILTKEQIKARKDKDAVASMKLARDNMEAALSRIRTLEYAVSHFNDLVNDMMKHIAEESHPYDSRESHKARFKKKQDEYYKYL